MRNFLSKTTSLCGKILKKNARLIHLPEKLKLNILDIAKAEHDTSKLDKYSCFVTECTYYFNVCRQSQGRRSILPLFFWSSLLINSKSKTVRQNKCIIWRIWMCSSQLCKGLNVYIEFRLQFGVFFRIYEMHTYHFLSHMFSFFKNKILVVAFINLIIFFLEWMWNKEHTLFNHFWLFVLMK